MKTHQKDGIDEADGNDPKTMPSGALGHVLRTPIRFLRFQDFMRLKVGGRDEYSGLRLDQLKQLVPEHLKVAEAIEDEAAIASCLRWMLRGLPLDKAIRKVRTDLEVAENAKGVKYDD